MPRKLTHFRGNTKPRWKRLVSAVERLGFAGLFRSDYFPGDRAVLELVVSLTYLADHTERIDFSPLVAPMSFRDLAMLARQAAAIDDLSGGRMILGLGAGWEENEHNSQFTSSESAQRSSMTYRRRKDCVRPRSSAR